MDNGIWYSMVTSGQPLVYSKHSTAIHIGCHHGNQTGIMDSISPMWSVYHVFVCVCVYVCVCAGVCARVRGTCMHVSKALCMHLCEWMVLIPTIFCICYSGNFGMH